MMNCNPIQQRPVYSEELFQSFYPAICKIMARTVLRLPQDSTNIDRFEDYVQYCRMLLHEQCELYDPERVGKRGKKCKFSTYMIMVFNHRLLTKYTNIMIKRNRHICTDLSNHVAPNEDYENETDISNFAPDSMYGCSIETQYAIKEHFRSLKNLIPAENYDLFQDYFIHGQKNREELKTKYSHLKYNQINAIIKETRKINKKMVENLYANLA